MHLDGRYADALLAAGLTVLGLTEGIAGLTSRSGPSVAVALVPVVMAAVATRRTRPAVSVTLLIAGTAAQAALGSDLPGGWSEGIATVIVVYSIGAHQSLRRGAVLTLVAACGQALTIVLAGDSRPGNFVYAATVLAVAWVAGRGRRLATERSELLAQRGVAQERARIARELHDVVAHSVSVMVVQAGAARRVLEKDPARAAEAMGSIESTGRQSLNELRRLLGMLRQADGEATGRVPQPSIEHVAALLDQTREAGLPVELEVEGDPRPLAAGVDLSAYRIVQEALTNTIKHAGPAQACVRLCYGADTLELVISDDGRGADCEEADRNGTSGHGLVGMRERVSLFGGDLQVGNRPGGGFTVRATLPLEVPA